tara:strand:+ start:826 stop:2076 length:1251 start_codon:yes stop_codon:yes gene_type:complete
MSGIATSGAGDVKLDGNPNAFTGTNTFDDNRPTSSLTTTPAATEFITKQDGEQLFQGTSGVALLASANAFVSTNTFNTNRPTSSLATTPAATEFITKQDGEALFTNNTGDAELAGGTSSSPQTFTEFNKFNKNLILGDDLTMLSTTETINFTIETDANFTTTINQDAGFNSLTQKVKAGGTNRNIITQDFFSNRTTGSKNDFIQDRSETNNIVQDGITNTITQQNGDCVITQLGLNSTITTAGKMICATIPTGTDTTMLVNKTYVDGVASGSGSFRSFAVADRRNPASTRSVTGVTKFDPNVVVYQYPTTITMWDFTQNHHSITIKGFYSFYWGAAQFSGNTSTRLTIYRNGVPQNTTGNNTYMCGNQVSAVFECDIADYIQVGCEVQNMCYYAFCDTTDPNSRYNTFNGYLLQAT